MPFKRKYSEEKLTEAMFLYLDKNMLLTEVSIITGIPVRTLQRYKRKYVEDLQEEKQEKTDYPTVYKGNAPVSNSDVQKQLDANDACPSQVSG